MGDAFLLMAVLSLGLLGVMHKVADHRACRPEAVNFVLFLGAAIGMLAAALYRIGPVRAFAIPPIAWVTACGCGLLASVAILSFQYGIRFGKISSSWLVINLSTALPTILSIVIYREAVSARRALGLGLCAVALVILWQERAREEQAGKSASIPGES